jgi:beclin 1
MGSYSKVQKVSGSSKEHSHKPSTSVTDSHTASITITSFDLFGSGDFAALGRLFFNRKFDQGLVAFLQCVAQLGDYCENLDDGFRLPYRIQKDRIGDVSIRLGFNQDEPWSRACKYLLTNLKWILAFVTKRTVVAGEQTTG